MRFMYRIFESTKSPIYQPTIDEELNAIAKSYNPPTPPPSTSTENSLKSTEKQDESTNDSFSNLSTTIALNVVNGHTQQEDTSKPIEEEDDAKTKERELQEFAKKRDLEWANLIRQSTDEPKQGEVKKLVVAPIMRNVRVTLENSKPPEFYELNKPSTVSKKRKKSKHSKHMPNYSKRRKLHAEIQTHNSDNQDDILKLKVKLTGHKIHKHKHNNDNKIPIASIVPNSVEISTKERLLQMRQVRHKQIEKVKIPEEDTTVKKVRFEDNKIENVPNLVAPKSFTVSKVNSQDPPVKTIPEIDTNVPSLEIMLVKPKCDTNFNNNTKTITNQQSKMQIMQNKMLIMKNLNLINKNLLNKSVVDVKKLQQTIPLSKIKKAAGGETFGALDLTSKSIDDVSAHGITKSESLANLHILSESAVR